MTVNWKWSTSAINALGFCARRLAASHGASCLGGFGRGLCRGLLRHHRDRFDLDQRAGPGEGGDRHCRARGRGCGVDEAIPHLPKLPDMSDVDEVIVELDDM